MTRLCSTVNKRKCRKFTKEERQIAKRVKRYGIELAATDDSVFSGSLKRCIQSRRNMTAKDIEGLIEVLMPLMELRKLRRGVYVMRSVCMLLANVPQLVMSTKRLETTGYGKLQAKWDKILRYMEICMLTSFCRHNIRDRGRPSKLSCSLRLYLKYLKELENVKKGIKDKRWYRGPQIDEIMSSLLFNLELIIYLRIGDVYMGHCSPTVQSTMKNLLGRVRDDWEKAKVHEEDRREIIKDIDKKHLRYVFSFYLRIFANYPILVEQQRKELLTVLLFMNNSHAIQIYQKIEWQIT